MFGWNLSLPKKAREDLREYFDGRTCGNNGG